LYKVKYPNKTKKLFKDYFLVRYGLLCYNNASTEQTTSKLAPPVQMPTGLAMFEHQSQLTIVPIS